MKRKVLFLDPQYLFLGLFYFLQRRPHCSIIVSGLYVSYADSRGVRIVWNSKNGRVFLIEISYNIWIHARLTILPVGILQVRSIELFPLKICIVWCNAIYDYISIWKFNGQWKMFLRHLRVHWNEKYFYHWSSMSI